MPAEGGIIDRAKQARDEAPGILAFGSALCAILVSTVGCLVFLIFLFLLPLIMLIIGSIHVHNCPVQKFIPIFLIVGGTFGILKVIVVGYLRRKSEAGEPIPNYWKTISGLYQSFLLIWFILGCVWTYGAYKPSYDPGSPNYCDKTVYLTAFWCLTISLILLAVGVGLLVCCCVCGFCCAAFFGDSDSSEPAPPPKAQDV